MSTDLIPSPLPQLRIDKQKYFAMEVLDIWDYVRSNANNLDSHTVCEQLGVLFERAVHGWEEKIRIAATDTEQARIKAISHQSQRYLERIKKLDEANKNLRTLLDEAKSTGKSTRKR